jgi:HAMP domain-containing protein
MRLFIFAVGLVAVAAIAASAWVYAETQRDLNRVATDIAQIRLSLQLFGQQQRPGDIAVPASDTVQDLSNRLGILEQNWRGQTTASGTAALPAVPGAATASTGPQTDCIPQGKRFLVANGDSYPICGTTAVVAVTEVAATYVSFTDGTIITAGGNAMLKGTQCTLAVVSSGADGMTGYAELRVGC